MFKRTLTALAALALLVGVQSARIAAQCANGRCLVPSRSATSGYQWRLREDDPDRRYLFHHDVCIGAYDVKLDLYRPYDSLTQIWGDCCAPPWTTTTTRTTATNNYGVDTSKLGSQEKYTLHTAAGSHQLTREAAEGLIGAQLQDDSQKLRVTVIGPDDKQKQVLTDLARFLADLGSWAIVRCYGADHWSVQPGFVKSGSPTIYCQAPSGKVLHRQDDYAGGGEALAEALRKAKANYDPKRDPDLRSPQDIDFTQTATYGLAAALGAGACQLLRRRSGFPA